MVTNISLKTALSQMRALHDIQTKTIIEQIKALQTLEEALSLQQEPVEEPNVVSDYPQV